MRNISIHKALAGLDERQFSDGWLAEQFQSTRPSRASTDGHLGGNIRRKISIHKALAGLDIDRGTDIFCHGYFNPQGPRGPRLNTIFLLMYLVDFNPQGPRGPRHLETGDIWIQGEFQSTRPSRASTNNFSMLNMNLTISIHKALAGLDNVCGYFGRQQPYFNPQGPRGPRQQNYPTIPPHPPNFLCIMSSPPYFNLLHPFTQPIFTAFPLFFRCESPRHFMLAWHSHLV